MMMQNLLTRHILVTHNDLLCTLTNPPRAGSIMIRIANIGTSGLSTKWVDGHSINGQSMYCHRLQINTKPV